MTWVDRMAARSGCVKGMSVWEIFIRMAGWHLWWVYAGQWIQARRDFWRAVQEVNDG